MSTPKEIKERIDEAREVTRDLSKQVGSLQELKERTDKARETAHALFREAGYREDGPSRMDSYDRLWYRRFGEEHSMHVHFEEFSWDDPTYPPDIRQNIPAGGELTFAAGTWTNTPHLRFKVHHVRINSIHDIKAAEAKILKFIDAFEVTRELNCQGDGMEQNVEFISVGPPDLGDRLALLRMPLLREKCTEFCPAVLKELEDKRKTWEESYEIHFSVRISCANPPGVSIARSFLRGRERGQRLSLLRLVHPDDLVQGELIDDELQASFIVDAGLYPWLREEIEEELGRLEGRVCAP